MLVGCIGGDIVLALKSRLDRVERVDEYIYGEGGEGAGLQSAVLAISAAHVSNEPNQQVEVGA